MDLGGGTGDGRVGYGACAPWKRSHGTLLVVWMVKEGAVHGRVKCWDQGIISFRGWCEFGLISYSRALGRLLAVVLREAGRLGFRCGIQDHGTMHMLAASSGTSLAGVITPRLV